MPRGTDDFTIDFGTEELNDPNYEQNIGGDDDGTLDTPPADGTDGQRDDTVTPGQQDGNDTVTGGQGNDTAPGEQREDDGNPAGAAYKADKHGNLIDKDGKIVARAGGERRSFERGQQQQRYIRTLETERDQLKQQTQQANALNGMPQQLGLTLGEAEMGMRAIQAFKQDPAAAARWMLQEAMRMGYNLKQIVGDDAQGVPGGGGSMDLNAIRSMIQEQVAPLIQDHQARQQSTQAEQEAQREYDAFLTKHDYADMHEDVIAPMMQQTGVTPEVAYWQLREYCAVNGLDFKKPLRDQVQSRQQGGQRQPSQPVPNGNANPQAQQQPMPNGGAPTQDMRNGPMMANPDDTWDSIVTDSLRDAGFN